jgi:hypothetical protein
LINQNTGQWTGESRRFDWGHRSAVD